MTYKTFLFARVLAVLMCCTINTYIKTSKVSKVFLMAWQKKGFKINNTFSCKSAITFCACFSRAVFCFAPWAHLSGLNKP